MSKRKSLNVTALTVPQILEIIESVGGKRRERRDALFTAERITRSMFTHAHLLERVVRGIIESKGDSRLSKLTLGMYPLALQDLMAGKTTTIVNMVDNFLKVHIRLGGDLLNGVDSTAIIFMPFFMTNIVGLPQTIAYRWLFEVLRLAREGNERARQYIHIGLFNAETRNIHFVPEPLRADDMERTAALLNVNLRRILDHQGRQDNEPVELHLPLLPELISTFQDIQDKIVVYLKQYRAELDAFLKTAGEQTDVLAERSCKLWEDICQRQRYAIRDNGLDRVVVDVRLLNYAGIREIAFFHEGFVAPEVGIRVTLDFWGECTSFKTSFSEKGLVCGSKDPWPGWLAALFSIVVLDSYHRIVVTNEPGARQLNRPNGRGERECKEKRWVVRPFLKHLRPGDTISKEAAQAAQYSLGKTPPTGFTFVHEHTRGYTPDAKVDVKPLFSYTMRDLANLIS